MAKVGQTIENPYFGEKITFIETIAGTNGKRGIRERVILPNHPREQRAHLHDTLTETFEILEGTARYRLGNDEHPLGAGETIEMPPKIPHIHPWNIGNTVLRVRQTVTVHTSDIQGVVAVEDYLVTTFGLARDGKLKPDGTPPFLQVAVSFRAMIPHAYLAGIPLGVQKVLFGLLAPIGEMQGYRVRYDKYEA
jgi:mannose-6-phosphate isomerase-like protein (cupin superfamily)